MARSGDSQRGDTLPLTRTSAERLGRGQGAEARFSLLVYHRDGVHVVPLGEDAPVTLGRWAPSDVVVEDHSLSRRHARFSLRDGKLTVEDLGSTNGTRVRGRQVEQAELRPGDVVAIGNVVVSPHMRAAWEAAQEGLASDDSFRATLDEELVRARHFGDGLAVLLVRSLQPEGDRTHVSQWWSGLSAALRPVDRAALYSAHALELMWPRMGPEEARERATELLRRAPRGQRLACGIATHPDSGDTAEQLLEASRHAIRRASGDDPVQLSEPVRAQAPPEHQLDEGPVVASPAMRELFETVDRLASARLPVVLYGETGTGKEVVARAIHERGSRSDAPMVCVNCGALPEQLVESTLFGHTRGAFTGAHKTSRGVFGSADGGTVLLDEVGELPMDAQAALLRALDSGRIRPVGATTETTVDVRVLAATHRDLEAMCDEGSFRRDLWFRLNAFQLTLPPLRERPEDIPALARRFLSQTVATCGGKAIQVTAEGMRALTRYPWPGNVRELRNAIERAGVIAQGDRITGADLPQRIREHAAAVPGRPAPPGVEPASGAPANPTEEDDQLLAGDDDLKTRVQSHEARLIAAALRRTQGNQTEAAQLLGVPVRTLSDKVRRLGIAIPKRG
ncbi:MAG: sigma 54-interacting transcriptional regulator [Deltaproteobacteria bacterium]|nr:sigma 54-interacting transcriptional regulator [Deltaproteobacteria bacterium]